MKGQCDFLFLNTYTSYCTMKIYNTEPVHGTIFVAQLGRPGHSAVAVAVVAVVA